MTLMVQNSWIFHPMSASRSKSFVALRNILPTSFGIDPKVTKPLSKVIALDLQSERNQQLVFAWTSRRTCLWVHFGVPCGTASRAREIRLSQQHHGSGKA